MVTLKEQVLELRQKCYNCKECPLGRKLVGGLDPHVFASGYVKSEVFFVGEAPGGEEVKMKRPLVGRAGMFFDNRILGVAGIERRSIFATNAVLCLGPNTLIKTVDGFIKISKIVNDKYDGHVHCVDEKGFAATSKVVNWYKNSRNGKRLYKIILKHSRKNPQGKVGGIFTEDHELLTKDGFKKINKLSSGDLIHSGSYQPPKPIYEALIGSLIGDGNISHHNPTFSHSLKQVKYCEHKLQIFGGTKTKKIINMGCQKQIGGRLKCTPYIRCLYRLLYDNKKKVLVEELLQDFSLISLSYLFMDDGYMRIREGRRPLAEIATCNFTFEEVELLSNRIKTLGVISYAKKDSNGYPRLFFSADETKKLSAMIAPYVHDSMKYKVMNEHHGSIGTFNAR
jgi:hypothetical protein